MAAPICNGWGWQVLLMESLDEPGRCRLDEARERLYGDDDECRRGEGGAGREEVSEERFEVGVGGYALAPPSGADASSAAGTAAGS
jgi:hypothetical protein